MWMEVQVLYSSLILKVGRSLFPEVFGGTLWGLGLSFDLSFIPGLQLPKPGTPDRMEISILPETGMDNMCDPVQFKSGAF